VSTVIANNGSSGNSNGDYEQDDGKSSRLKLYDGLSKTVDAVIDHQVQAGPEATYNTFNELAIQREKVVALLEQLGRVQVSKADAKAVAAQCGLLREMLTDATKDVIDSALKAARIRQLGQLWDEPRVRGFMQRLFGLLLLEFSDHPARIQRVLEQCEGVYQQFAEVQASTYTPDQDLQEMDQTVPRF